MKTKWDVIVVGGGLAGLAAGAVAAKAGASTLVLEAHEPGGRARTTDRDGFILNMGAHALYNRGAGATVLRSLGIKPQGSPPPLHRYRALTNGIQYQLPTGPSSLLRTKLLGWRGKAQFSKLLTGLPKLDPARLRGASANDWIAAQELRPDVALLVRALLRLGTYTADFNNFAADAAVAQMQLAASGGVVYLDGGWKQLIDQLAERVEVRAGSKVVGLEPAAGRIEIKTTDTTFVARAVVLSPGGPAAVMALLSEHPGWTELGAPITAACLDVGVRRIPKPGYVLDLDHPLYVTVQGPPARQAPDGQAVVAALRYGARSAKYDRAQLERLLGEAGITPDDVVVSRFLARMVVAGAAPVAQAGGLPGRPPVTASGIPGVYLAGDWVGGEGLLSDASMASGRAAALLAVGERAGHSVMVG